MTPASSTPHIWGTVTGLGERDESHIDSQFGVNHDDNSSHPAEDDLLDTSFELTDKGEVLRLLTSKMKIAFSLIPGCNDNVKEFIKRVVDDVSHMNSLSLPSSMSTLGQVLKASKAIMDQVSQVVHFSSLNS